MSRDGLFTLIDRQQLCLDVPRLTKNYYYRFWSKTLCHIYTRYTLTLDGALFSLLDMPPKALVYDVSHHSVVMMLTLLFSMYGLPAGVHQ